MFDLPKSAYFGKIIPKEKIYSHSSAGASLEALFVEQVERIRWLYKISPKTLNIAPGNNIDEIEIIEITLRLPEPDKRILSTICKAIPQKIVFSVVFGNMIKYSLYYDKETYYSFDAAPELIGNNIDSVWENFVMQIGSITVAHGRTLDEQISFNKEREKLIKTVSDLDKQARREKQPRRKYELAEEVRKFNMELELMPDG